MASRARLIAAVFAALLVAACSGTPDRPVPGTGTVARVVGGGGHDIFDNTDNGWPATGVEGNDLVAMAVEADGTLWLAHADGALFRVGTDGRIAPVLVYGLPRTSERAALAMGPDRVLYFVADTSRVVTRLSIDDPRLVPIDLDPNGLPTGYPITFTGIAVAPDRTVYLADGGSGVVYHVRSDNQGIPVPGTPPPPRQCQKPRLEPPYPIGLALTSAGRLVIADPGCPALYRPQDGPIADRLDCPQSTGQPAEPVVVTGTTGGRLVVGSGSCELVWRVSPGSGDPLAGDQDLTGLPRAVGADRKGTVYVLDDEGVLAIR